MRTPLSARSSYFNVQYANSLKHERSIATQKKVWLHQRCKMLLLLKFPSTQKLSVHVRSHKAPCSTHTTGITSQTDGDSVPVEVTGVCFPPATSCSDSLTKNLTIGRHAEASSIFGIKDTTSGFQRQATQRKVTASRTWTSIAQLFTG